ncbi:MAG TPA: IS200/IS605 family transposase [Phycisphaerae bacterium]
MTGVKTMAHTYCSCLVHYVFSTKGRRNSIAAELRPRLWSYIGGIARENEMKALAVGGTDNHCHALVSLPTTLSIAQAVQKLKGGSSLWIHESFPTQASFAWQEGYGAFSIGVAGVADTIAYIDAQEEHHRTKSFEEEYIAFLERHGIEYDARFVFD